MKQNLDLLINGGNVFLHNELIEEIDIGVLNGKIVELVIFRKEIVKNFSKNLLVLPGAIDSQVHFREPGLTHKEDIMHGTKGAALGGITTIF